MFGATPEEKAYFAPFLALVGLILLGQVTAWFFDGRLVPWMLGEPAYWVNPAQALIGGALLLRSRRFYPLAAPRQAWLALGVGVIVLLLWLAPQELLGVSPRYTGFNPFFFGPSGAPYWITLVLR